MKRIDKVDFPARLDHVDKELQNTWASMQKMEREFHQAMDILAKDQTSSFEELSYLVISKAKPTIILLIVLIALVLADIAIPLTR